MSAPSIWAVVPIKSLPHAKQRLAPLLDACERRRLGRAMAEDVLAACMSTRSVAGTVVVTGDREVKAIAERAGAIVLEETRESGTNAAICAGVRAVAGHADGVIILPTDVPHVTVDALEAVARLCGRKDSLVLVPASRDGGTNLLACAPPDLIQTSFGPGSFARHCEIAARAGLEPRVAVLGRLDLDLDRPGDLAVFLALTATTRTHRVLFDLGIPLRLGTMPEFRSKGTSVSSQPNMAHER